jgi:mono/diheme cytochrome c family protein
LTILVALGAIGIVIFYFLSRPDPIAAAALPAHTPDLDNGRIMYTAGGCIGCHRPTPESGRQADLPSGGKPLSTPVGALYPPNITSDPDSGIGRWTDADFVNAVSRGLTPGGSHYIPAFPYTSYNRMRIEDILDLKAYLFSLPPVKADNPARGLPLDPVARLAIGVWKRAALADRTFTPDPNRGESWNRGYYLVTGPGHCGECHTPRSILMIADGDRLLAGGPHPEGKGRVPSLRNLVPRRYASPDELVSAMRFGEMMGFDRLSSGGMAEVQANLAKLPEEDVRAIAEYLVSLK